MKKRILKTLKKLIKISIPLWMVFFLVLNSSMAVGVLEYYLMKRNFNKTLTELAEKTKSPDDLVKILKQEVLPQSGYILSVTWNDIGSQLLESGVIDKEKYESQFAQEPQAKPYMKYLTQSSKDHLIINENNSHFMVNTLWALGLVNKSKILDKGSMKTYGQGDVMSFASTGGWNLGSKPTGELYSSEEIIKLTPEQENLVEKIAKNVYRPCCNNNTEFPDCNHGMAALGYIQLAVKQGIPEKQIYKDLLALNSFWFPQSYVEMAVFMNKQNTKWKDVDPQLALSARYSSSQGSQQIKQAIQNVPGLNIQSGGCGT